MKNLKDIFMFRHATTIFDGSKIIPSDIIQDILMAGQMSPSSFGLEPWRFIVLKKQRKTKRNGTSVL